MFHVEHQGEIMDRIPIQIIFEGEWPEDQTLLSDAFVDEAVVRREGVNILTDMLVLAPARDISAEYKITTEIQHHEANGAHFWQPMAELTSVSKCTYEGYQIQNAHEVCWKLWEWQNG